jgi:hypothetical protein
MDIQGNNDEAATEIASAEFSHLARKHGQTLKVLRHFLIVLFA